MKKSKFRFLAAFMALLFTALLINACADTNEAPPPPASVAKPPTEPPTSATLPKYNGSTLKDEDKIKAASRNAVKNLKVDPAVKAGSPADATSVKKSVSESAAGEIPFSYDNETKPTEKNGVTTYTITSGAGTLLIPGTESGYFMSNDKIAVYTKTDKDSFKGNQVLEITTSQNAAFGAADASGIYPNKGLDANVEVKQTYGFTVNTPEGGFKTIVEGNFTLNGRDRNNNLTMKTGTNGAYDSNYEENFKVTVTNYDNDGDIIGEPTVYNSSKEYYEYYKNEFVYFTINMSTTMSEGAGGTDSTILE
ncbi:hypothetical protein AGMMS50212_01330 [Spirochaetia bacterium]|nr:hypothetical protein AGMMS50212_01330 [Spirochaetia bacterium]